jgi:hypothetical protein
MAPPISEFYVEVMTRVWDWTRGPESNRPANHRGREPFEPAILFIEWEFGLEHLVFAFIFFNTDFAMFLFNEVQKLTDFIRKFAPLSDFA